MWTRKELKDKAKVSFRGNYWKAVLVGLVVLAISAGMGASVADVAQTSSTFSDPYASYESGYQDGYSDGYDDWQDSHGSNTYGDEYGPSYEYDDDYLVSPAPMLSGAQQAAMAVGIAVIVLAVIALAFAAAVFLGGPLEVGAARFFLRNLNQKSEAKEVAYAFDHNYLETVKTVFFRDLFILLWSLLLVVPGIVKAYEYRMIPYLLAEDPTMTKNQAFAESKRLMTGQKWNAFVLDLSFLGWNVLSALTLGILAVFYVAPYQNLANAALYEKLRYGLPQPDPQSAYYGPEPVQPAGAAGPGSSFAGQTEPYAQAGMPAQAPAPASPYAAPSANTQDASVAAGKAETLVQGDYPPVPAAEAMKQAPDRDRGPAEAAATDAPATDTPSE